MTDLSNITKAVRDELTLLTFDEAAALVKCSPRTLRVARDRGELRVIWPMGEGKGRLQRIHPDDLKAWYGR